MSIVLIVAVVCYADSDQKEKPEQKGFQREKVMENLEHVKSETKERLAMTLAHLETADSEIRVFAARKGSERVKEHFWAVSETTDTNGVVVLLRADFASETGPIRYGSKRIFKDRSYQEELKDQGYEIYYHDNGTVKMYLPKSQPSTVLELYPSGKIKQFGVVEGKETITELRCAEDGSVKYEKVKENRKARKNNPRLRNPTQACAPRSVTHIEGSCMRPLRDWLHYPSMRSTTRAVFAPAALLLCIVMLW